MAVVDAEAVVLEEPVGAVLDHERAAEARDDAVVVAQPADGRGGAVGAGEGVRVDVERAAVGRARPGVAAAAAGAAPQVAVPAAGTRPAPIRDGQGGEDAEADEVGPPGGDPGAA